MSRPVSFCPSSFSLRSDRTIESMQWGLVPKWAKEPNIGYKMINARSEGIFEKPSWRGPIKYQRCLVPANGFYEWRREASGRVKTPYFIHPKDQGLFAFAGIYEIWHDPQGNELWSYAIITTTPNAEMTSVHDRMPVILHPDDWELWLDPRFRTEAPSSLYCDRTPTIPSRFTR